MVFEILANYPDWLVLIAFSIVIGVVNALIYKHLGNSKRMGELKKELKALTNEYKKSKSEKVLKKVDKVQSEYMKLSFKPMIISMIVVFMLFPIIVNMYGDIKGSNSVILLGDNFTVSYTNGTYVLSGPTTITTSGIFQYRGKTFEITHERNGFKVSRVILLLPFDTPLVGKTIGWILFYIIISLPLMPIVRKVVGVEI